MKSKILSLILSFLIIATIPVFANEVLSSYGEDWEDKQGMALVNLLSEPQHFTSDENGYISRADFLYTLSKLAGIPTDASPISVFEDVDSESFVAGSVSSAYSLGYISKAQHFNPYNPIRTNEALKLAVCFTGFKNLAEVKGGYPTGYLTVAGANKFIYGSESFSGEFLTYGEAKVLISRLMTCNYMKNSSIKQDGTLSYEIYDGVTLLSDVHNILPFEGLVTATPESSLTSPSYLSEDNVEIDGVSYKAECNVNDFLGYRVKGLCREVSSKYTIIYVDYYNNTELTLKGDEFLYNQSLNEITYQTGDSEENVPLDSLYNFVYNGRAYPGHNNLLFGNSFATYKFVNSDDDKDFDTVYMTEQQYMKISSLDDYSTYIGDATGFSPAINVSLADIMISVTKADGTKCDWFSLTEGTVVAATVSKDKKLVKMRELDEIVTGVAQEFDNTNNKIIIDGKSYKISSYLLNEIGDIKLGNEYSIVTDDDILVALSGGISSSESYGYMIKAAPERSGLSGKGLIKILTESGEIKIFETAEKVKLNGAGSYTYNDETFWSALSSRQLVKYSLDGDGRIKLIRTATIASETPFDEAYNENNSFRKFNTPSPVYRSRIRSFSPYARIDTAKFFVVPINDDYAENESKYGVVPWNSPIIALDNNETYNDEEFGYVEMYDISENGECPVVVIKHNTYMDSNDKAASVGVVEKVTSVLTESGSDKKIYLISNGQYVSYSVANGVSADFKCGDIVQYVVNSNKGEISYIKRAFIGKTAAIESGFSSNLNNFSSSASYISTRVYSAGNGYMYLSPVSSYSSVADYSWSSLKSIRYSEATIVVYDYQKDTIRIGSGADLIKYRESGVGSYIVAKVDQYLDASVILVLENR